VSNIFTRFMASLPPQFRTGDWGLRAESGGG
jgi:hypothetical protein